MAINKIPILLTAEELRSIIDVSLSSKDLTVVDRAIRDAQNADLAPLLGFNFYSSIIQDPSTPAMVALLDGGTYEFIGRQFFNPGIKVVLANYAYPRYVMANAQKDTPFGMVQKQMQESEAISTARLKEIGKEHKQVAYQYWAQVQLFLDRNTETYEHWLSDCLLGEKDKSVFRIRKINKK